MKQYIKCANGGTNTKYQLAKDWYDFYYNEFLESVPEDPDYIITISDWYKMVLDEEDLIELFTPYLDDPDASFVAKLSRLLDRTRYGIDSPHASSIYFHAGNLAYKIAKFYMRWDPYDFKDAFGEDFSEAQESIRQALLNNPQEIYDWIKECTDELSFDLAENPKNKWVSTTGKEYKKMLDTILSETKHFGPWMSRLIR